ncbi:MAG TPA: DNA repair protein RecN [Chitinophagaceae bacterium]|nr:DNA repair protein RecN [Chitinophagaceae bacterium]HMZ47136.1 DNA repair protein RecN [Chitinophagaceae bacterium]HNM35372.1 DNA repair protein RecN [Chitinophagaceae bacterium]
MLSKLHIQNYAIIDEIEINFFNELNIITGETGAGKSIIMGALNLILGERADSTYLLNQNKKCFIEGLFITEKKEEIVNFLRTNDFDILDELVLRREIATNGKSRAFINDSPATLIQLKQLAALLVDLHQQFDTLELSNSHFQRNVVDALANNAQILSNYQRLFLQWQSNQKKLEELILQRNNFSKEADYNKYLLQELEEINLKENEIEGIENELEILNNSTEIKTALNALYFELKDNETPIIVKLKQLSSQLNSYAAYHQNIQSITDRIQTLQIELDDIANEAATLNNAINLDENKIEILNEKLSLCYKLYKKHNVQSSAGLIAIQNELEEKLKAVLNIDEVIKEKEKEAKDLLSKISIMAKEISASRNAQLIPIEKKVNSLLHQIGMPNANIKIELKEVPLNYYGKDNVEFLFDANKSNKFEPINKVASGGELSRLMLCIKSLVAQSIDLPTLIFDEIDSGISGEAAKQVGIIMQQLAAKRQIICITHQPQIAGKANAHFYVYKEIKNDIVKTNIKLLNNDERIINIAKMLSGEKPSTAAIESAKEMMN